MVSYITDILWFLFLLLFLSGRYRETIVRPWKKLQVMGILQWQSSNSSNRSKERIEKTKYLNSLKNCSYNLVWCTKEIKFVIKDNRRIIIKKKIVNIALCYKDIANYWLVKHFLEITCFYNVALISKMSLKNQSIKLDKRKISSPFKERVYLNILYLQISIISKMLWNWLTKQKLFC